MALAGSFGAASEDVPRVALGGVPEAGTSVADSILAGHGEHGDPHQRKNLGELAQPHFPLDREVG